MTVINTTRKITTAGTGSQTTFTFPYRVLDTAHNVINLIVIATGVKTLQVEGVDYSMTLNTITEGGTVTFLLTDPPATDQVFQKRTTPRTQPTDIPNRGSVREDQLETEYDRSRLIDIEQEEDLSRAILQDEATAGQSFTLPVLEEDKLLGWGASDLENVENPAVAAAASATAAAADAVSTAADAVSTAADVVSTNADVVLTNADAVSTAASLAAIRPSMTNKSGGGHVAGDVGIIDSANAGSVKNSTTQGDEKVILVATGTIANNAVGTYQTGAGEISINIKGSISIGDFVRLSSTAKQAESAGSTAVSGTFAQAQASGTNALVNCVLGVPAISVSGDIKKHSSEPQMTTLRGIINSDAGIAVGTGFTVTDNGPGDHTINHTASFNARPTAIGTVDWSSDVNRIVFDGGTAGASRFRTFDSADSAADEQFGFFILGEE